MKTIKIPGMVMQTNTEKYRIIWHNENPLCDTVLLATIFSVEDNKPLVRVMKLKTLQQRSYWEDDEKNQYVYLGAEEAELFLQNNVDIWGDIVRGSADRDYFFKHVENEKHVSEKVIEQGMLENLIALVDIMGFVNAVIYLNHLREEPLIEAMGVGNSDKELKEALLYDSVPYTQDIETVSLMYLPQIANRKHLEIDNPDEPKEKRECKNLLLK